MKLKIVTQRSRLPQQGSSLLHVCSAIRNASTAFLKSKPACSRSRLTYLAFGTAGAGLAAYFFIPSKSISAPTYDTRPLSASYFTPATLTSSENSGPDTKLLTLRVPPHLLHLHGDPSIFTPIWSVFIKDDDIQVERPYTPLEGVDEDGRMLFWIKQYEKGEVGRWLHSKKVGDTIEIRGPLKTWAWQDDTWDDVVMISGGTGITPFYQLLHNVISRGPQNLASDTRFILLHSSRIPSELPSPSMLQSLASMAKALPDRFKMHLFVDSLDGPANTSLSNHELQVGRISKTDIEQSLDLDTSASWWQTLFKAKATPSVPGRSRKILFLVCGPEQMIAAIAGPYGRNFSQGEIGGVLKELGFTSSQVRKL